MTDHYRGRSDGAGGAARPSASFAEQALRDLESGDGIFESAIGHRTSTLSSVLNQGEENDDEESSDDGAVTMDEGVSADLCRTGVCRTEVGRTEVRHTDVCRTLCGTRRCGAG